MCGTRTRSIHPLVCQARTDASSVRGVPTIQAAICNHVMVLNRLEFDQKLLNQGQKE